MAGAHSAAVPFSEVASLQSLSLLRQPAKTRSHPQADFSAPRPVTEGNLVKLHPDQRTASKDLPLAEFRPGFQQEQNKKKRDELRRLETCLEKVVMKERRAQRRSEQDMMLIEYHRNRAAETQQKIQRLQEKLPAEQRAEERLPRRMADPLGHNNTWGPTSEGRWAPGFPAISQQRPSLLASANSRAGSSGMASRSTPSLASSPQRRTMQPMTQIVMIPMPDYTKKSSEHAHFSKSTSAPALGTSNAVDAASETDFSASHGSQHLATSSRETRTFSDEDYMEREDAAPAGRDEPVVKGQSAGRAFADGRALHQTGHLQPSAERAASNSNARSRRPKDTHTVPHALEAGDADEDSHGGSARASSKNASPTGARASSSMASHMADRSHWHLKSRHSAFFDEPIDVAEVQREAIRVELIYTVGGALEAFRCMDLSGSGKISLQEFADGIDRIGLPWRELTGFKKPRELFKLFDQDRDGLVNLMDLFPEENMLKEDTHRMSTPEWWGHWCRKNKDVEPGQPRGPKWQFSGPEEELQILHDAQQAKQGSNQRRRWMSSTIRRMKGQGKSDARCRECCALHLPRGTGPKDREDVSTFSEMEVKTCKRAYNDEVNTPARNIQKTVYEMREQRRLLQNSRLKLYSVTGREQTDRVNKESELKKQMAGLRFSFRKPEQEGDKDGGEEYSEDEYADFGE